MTIILTSNLNNYDDNKQVKKIDNINYLVDNIKKNLKGNRGIFFISSQKNNDAKTNMYASILFESLKLDNIIFDNYYVLTSSEFDKVSECINNSDLLFLCGGDTYEQHLLFEEINLRELLKNYNGLIIGQSAGSMNLAIDVYNSPEDYNDTNIYFKGLGLVGINIEPHFDINNINKHILEESYKRVIYGLPEKSYILITGDSINYYGDVYLISKGEVNVINKCA